MAGSVRSGRCFVGLEREFLGDFFHGSHPLWMSLMRRVVAWVPGGAALRRRGFPSGCRPDISCGRERNRSLSQDLLSGFEKHAPMLALLTWTCRNGCVSVVLHRSIPTRFQHSIWSRS